MRIFLLILVVAFVIATTRVAAQTPHVRHIFDEGARLAQSAQYEKAFERYQKVLLLSKVEKMDDHFLARIHFNGGVCLYHLKQTNGAVEEFTEAIKLSRRNYQKAFYALGLAHAELGDWRRAEKALRAAVSLKEKDGEAWFDLGLVLLEEKDYDGARGAFQKAIKYKSVAAADAHNNIGVILALQDDFLSAEKEFLMALRESAGRSIEARRNLAFCHSYKQTFNRDLLAKFEFSRKNKTGE